MAVPAVCPTVDPDCWMACRHLCVVAHVYAIWHDGSVQQKIKEKKRDETRLEKKLSVKQCIYHGDEATVKEC